MLRITKVEGIENGVMLYEVVDFKLPSPSAIVIEFGRLPSMIGLMRRFKKAALLTDKTWLKKVSEFEGALIPGWKSRRSNWTSAKRPRPGSAPEGNGRSVIPAKLTHGAQCGLGVPNGARIGPRPWHR